MTGDIALRLGRVSNLPTVWSNALAGLVLAGGLVQPLALVLVLVAASLAYTGGMFLNDAFDAEIDARQCPERPIPCGQATREEVLAYGFAMLGASVAVLAIAGFLSGTAWRPAMAGVVLVALIIFYDLHHKQNPFGPVVMGLCRVLVYVAAGFVAATSLPATLWIGAGLILCHLIGLTYVAKQENQERVANLWPLGFLAVPLLYGLRLAAGAPVALFFWAMILAAVLLALHFMRRRGPSDMPRAVTTLIATISLIDALLITAHGRTGLGLLAGTAFLLTLALQRFVRGT